MCVLYNKALKSLSLALLHTMCVYVLEHRVRFHAIHILYICTYTIYIVAWKSENRTLERFESIVSGGAVRRKIIDMFALFDYSKVVESGRSAEHRTLERFGSCVSGGAVRRRIVDMFALFDYSKAAEALSVHAHAGLHM